MLSERSSNFGATFKMKTLNTSFLNVFFNESYSSAKKFINSMTVKTNHGFTHCIYNYILLANKAKVKFPQLKGLSLPQYNVALKIPNM